MRCLARGGTWWLAAAALLLILAGCGSGPGEPLQPDGGGGTASPSTPAPTRADTSTPAPTPGQSTAGSAQSVAYVPWGPSDPVIPEHYTRLAADPPNCEDAAASAPSGEFWDAVVGVCRALTGTGQWPAIQTAPPVPETDNPHERCLDAELSGMMQAALAWRGANGDGRPTVTRSNTGSACYLTVYRAAEGQRQDGASTAELLLDSTYSLASVAVDGAVLDPDSYTDLANDAFIGTRTVTLLLPPETAGRTVSVEVALQDDQGSPRGTVSASVAISAEPVVQPTLGPLDEGGPEPTDDASPEPS